MRPGSSRRAAAAALVLAAASAAGATQAGWRLPLGFPEPAAPFSAALVELGRHLFHDPRLSGNGTQSCASCHRQELAFTDGRANAVGSTAVRHPRSAMSLANVGYNASLTWADSAVTGLEQQALVPLLNENPVEMGVGGREAEVLARFRALPRYRDLFQAALPGELVARDLPQLAGAIAAFERTLVSGRSPYDRMLYDGAMEALSVSAWRGMRLFFSDRLACSKCHAGFNFSGPTVYLGSTPTAPTFHDTGLYDGDHYAASGERGLESATGRAEHRGRFRAPTLRNIAVTAPYMHDGSVATLDAVIEHYAMGGRAGVTRPLLSGFTVTADDRRDLIAFLHSLTDESFLRDPRFSDPFEH